MMAMATTSHAPIPELLHLAEALRPLIWTGFMIAVLRRQISPTQLVIGTSLAIVIAAAQFASSLFHLGPQERFGTGLLASVLVLVCLEQLYRNLPDGQRWSIKFLCLALLALFGFDVVLYSDALLFGRFESGWFVARGYANALMVPLIAVTAARAGDSPLAMRLSRKIVFHSATLLASGLFLLAVSAIGYGLRYFGGEWGGVAQLVVVFAAVVGVIALAASGRLRAQMRVMLAKHFFTYRYDYRTEWLKLTDLVARSEQPGTADSTLSYRALQGLAGLVECQASALWLRTEQGNWVCDARRDLTVREPIAADDPLPRFLAERQWIIDVPEWRKLPERYQGLTLPAWLTDDPQAWLIVPLELNDELIGIAQLQRPAASIPLDWEVRDVLKAAGRQVAGYLAVSQAVEKLVQARQFDSFNRMSAFVVHDLKNLVAQLSLLLKNAARHRDNPEFQRDMLETVENVLDRMQGLLMQLRVGTKPIEQPAPLMLAEVLAEAVESKRGIALQPELTVAESAKDLLVVAHRDRLERVIGHLVQNAIEATPSSGSVRIEAGRDGQDVLVNVIDTGAGMSREFIDTQLFKPFSSTKEHGMGIGAFESREYIREIGGSLAVASTEGRGTRFTVRLPVHGETGATSLERTADVG
jgi:putative PEP-CTERM system histidine kinase